MFTRTPLNHIKVAAAAMIMMLGLGGCKCSPSSKSGAGGAGDVKIFHSFRSSDFKTLDPMKQFDQASAEIVSNVYDTLLQYSYLERPYQLEPSLLEKMPEKQADGVTYLFTLRQGVLFNDDACFPEGKGREMKIDDVIYSIKRFADVNVNQLSFTLIKGFVVGLDEFHDQTEKAGKNVNYDSIPVTGIKKLNDYQMTVTFTRDNPLAFFPFAFSGMSIVPKEAVEKYGTELDMHPVGSGPFYIKEMNRRGNIILAKNTKYWGKYPSTGPADDQKAGLLADAGKQLPLVDEIHMPLIEESQPRMLKFLKGDIDSIGIDKDYFEKMAFRDDKGEFHLKDEYAKQFSMYVEPSLSMEYITFNMNDKLMGKNKALRQAIAYALDNAAYIKLLLNDRGVNPKTIVPVPIAGSERDIDATYYEHNKEMAKKKLAEAGFPDGKGLPELTMEFRHTNKTVRETYELIRSQLAEVGIPLKANFQTFSSFLQRVEAGNFQIAEAAWGADYPDAENFYMLLYSANKSPGPNNSNYANKKYDELYEKIRFMPNGPERNKIFKEMSDILREDVPVFYRVNALAFGMYQKHLTNVKRHMMIDAPYKYYNIDPSQRKLSH